MIKQSKNIMPGARPKKFALGFDLWHFTEPISQKLYLFC
jgi:hypothetical protein